MTDEQILAAAGEWDIFVDSVNTLKESPTAIFDLYRAAYAAGMEAASVMCQQIANGHTQAAMNARRVSEVDIEEDRGIGASECVVAIRAANGREGKQ